MVVDLLSVVALDVLKVVVVVYVVVVDLLSVVALDVLNVVAVVYVVVVFLDSSVLPLVEK